ncbi:MAG: DUF3105 domain-containing protein [Actinomycetota bacterium]
MVDRPEPEPWAHAELSRRNVRLGAVVIAVIIGIVGLGLLRSGKSSGAPELTGALRRSVEQQGCRADSRADKGQAHVPAAAYSVNPPAGGDHDPVPSPAGFYTEADVPTDGHLVHSLEHGFVIIWYQPAGVSAATLDWLRDLAGRAKWILVVPRPSMATPLAATAWHRRLLCPDGPDMQEPISTFVTAFRNQGPEKGFV